MMTDDLHHQLSAIRLTFCYTQCPEKTRPQYSGHKYDKFRHSFVIFGTNHPDTSV